MCEQYNKYEELKKYLKQRKRQHLKDAKRFEREAREAKNHDEYKLAHDCYLIKLRYSDEIELILSECKCIEERSF